MQRLLLAFLVGFGLSFDVTLASALSPINPNQSETKSGLLVSVATSSQQVEANSICSKAYGKKGFRQAIYKGRGVADCLGAGSTLKQLRIIGQKGCAQRGVAFGSVEVLGGGKVNFGCRPTDADAHLKSGQANNRIGDLKAAKEVNQKVLALSPTPEIKKNSKGDLSQLSVNPNSWKDCNGNADNSDRSIEACTAIIDAGTEPAKNVAIAYLNRGIAARENYDNAIPDFNAAIALNQKLVEAYYRRAKSYHVKLGTNNASPQEYVPAIADFNKVIALDPRYMDAYFDLFNIYDELKDTDSQNAILSAAIAVDPKNSRAYYYRGMLFDLKGNPQSAIVDFTNCIAVAPADLPCLFSRISVMKEFMVRGNARTPQYREFKDKLKSDLTKLIALDRDDTYGAAAMFKELDAR